MTETVFFAWILLAVSAMADVGRYRRRTCGPPPDATAADRSEARGGDRVPLAVHSVGEIVRSGRTLILSGEIDLDTIALLADARDELIASCVGGPDDGPEARLPDDKTNPASPGEPAKAPSDENGSVVIDATGLTFIDATGLGALIGLHRSLATAGIGLRTIHPSDRFRRVSAICQLDGVLGVEPMAQGAIDTQRSNLMMSGARHAPGSESAA